MLSFVGWIRCAFSSPLQQLNSCIALCVRYLESSIQSRGRKFPVPLRAGVLPTPIKNRKAGLLIYCLTASFKECKFVFRMQPFLVCGNGFPSCTGSFSQFHPLDLPNVVHPTQMVSLIHLPHFSLAAGKAFSLWKYILPSLDGMDNHTSCHPQIY